MTEREYEKKYNKEDSLVYVKNTINGVIGWLMSDYELRVGHELYRLTPELLQYWVLDDSPEAEEIRHKTLKEPETEEEYEELKKKILATFGTPYTRE